MADRFDLLERLGKGGMGVVWKARDTETGEIVALKLLHSIYADEPDYVARFEREVEIAQRIHSPHVVEVRGFGVREGVPYMAMEYVEGENLLVHAKFRGRLSWSEARPILRDVAEGLAAAHACGVIHRDVKPSNILVGPNGRAKLADFGIARAMDMTRLTSSVTMLGSPAYMAPDEEIDQRSDIYSLGCVGYELLTGMPPFSGGSLYEVVGKHQRGNPNMVELDGPARHIVEQLMKPEASLRPTATTIVAMLSSSPHRQVRARVRTFSSPALAASVMLSRRSGGSRPTESRSTVRESVLVLSGASLVAAGIIWAASR